MKMECPKCKASVESNAVECKVCGVIFKKFDDSRSIRLAQDREKLFESVNAPILSVRMDIILPLIAFLFAWLMKMILPKLVWALSMWVHEFGHATTAWFGGMAATPFLGWTTRSGERSWTVTMCFTALLGILGYKSWEKKSYFLVVTFILFFFTQMYFRFVINEEKLDFMFSYMGIGGEFWISTWLIIAYHYYFPEYTQWRVLKYAALFVGAFVFFNAFSMWKNIYHGYAEFPWGSLWSGEDHGDMNTLRDEFGWQTFQITSSYVKFGTICVTIIIVHYIFQIGRFFIFSEKNSTVDQKRKV